MKTKRLGSKGPELSVIGFGAWEAGAGTEWGTPPPEERIMAAIRSVMEVGINWIDTAEVYGDGRSEEIVALAITGHRDELVLATKLAPAPDGSGFRPEDVRRGCIGSMRRLRTGHIDLYQLHWPDDSGVPVEETWGAMAELADEGLVRHLGVSNFDRELIERCEAVRHVDALQQEFSMLMPDDRELIRWCGEQGIGVVSYGPLAYGLLTGAITKETTYDATDFRGGHEEWDFWQKLCAPGKLERSLAVLDAMRPIARRLGATLAQLSLAWNVHQPGVTAAIAGSRDPDHVRSNAAAGDLDLDDATLSEVDTLLSLGPAFG